MTAGSYMYIGPGIVHGTTITVLNAFRKINRSPSEDFSYFRAGWHEWSPTKQEILLVALRFVLRSMQRLHICQGWINEVIEDIDELVKE
jgi:urocanate hydratase